MRMTIVEKFRRPRLVRIQAALPVTIIHSLHHIADGQIVVFCQFQMVRPAFQHLQIRKRGILPGGKKHRNHRASPLGKKPPDDGFIRTEGLFRIRHHIVVQRKIKNDQIRFKTKNIPLHTINTELGTGSADRRIDKFPAGARIFRPESLPDQRPITCPVRIGCVRPPCQGPAEKHDRQRISPLRAPVKLAQSANARLLLLH